jgi:hypothetical protein
MPGGDGGKLEEILRLTKENNRMLHAMRRNAFLHGLFRFVIYAVLIIAAGWFYLTFIAPIMIQMLDMLNKIQGASSQAQGQFSEWSNTLNSLKDWIPGVASTSTR